MLSDPEITVTCDVCKLYGDVFPLTATARGGYDERGIEWSLKSRGWTVTDDGRHICQNCAAAPGALQSVGTSQQVPTS